MPNIFQHADLARIGKNDFQGPRGGAEGVASLPRLALPPCANPKKLRSNNVERVSKRIRAKTGTATKKKSCVPFSLGKDEIYAGRLCWGEGETEPKQIEA